MADLGIDVDDCAVLAHEVVEELVQNVRDHGAPVGASRPAPLFGLVQLSANAYYSRIEDFDAPLHQVISWAGAHLSPLIRIFVGDSGQGFQVADSDMEASVASTQDAVIRAMDTWTPSPLGGMPTRGLWRIDRIAKSYSGSLILITRGAAAGHVFDHTTGWKAVKGKLPYAFPGTIAECNIPILPGRLRPLEEDEHYSFVSPLPAQSALNLRCVAIHPGTAGAIDSRDFHNVQAVLSNLRPGDGLVIATELQRGFAVTSSSDLPAFVRSVLDLASSAADLAPVGVMFAGLNRTILALALAEYNMRADAAFEKAPSNLSSTFLVVAPENHHYWVGGAPQVRATFGRLSQFDDPMPLEEDVLNDTRVIRQIRFQHGLRLHEAFAGLRLRPQHVVQCARRHISGQLQGAITAASSAGVTSGTFLTPSLRYTSRWIEVQKILVDRRCTSVASFLLAAMAADRIGPYLSRTSDVSVVRVGSVSREVAAVFAVSLSGSANYHDEPADIHAADPRLGQAGTSVIICTDLVSTAQTIRQTVRALYVRGATVLAVAAIVDARDRNQDPDPDHVLVDGHAIPLIFISQASISAASASGPYTPIDPVIGAPIEGVTPRVRTRIDQRAYMSAVERVSAARLGHIVRAGRRHYTAYVDPTLLFRDRIWAATALHEMLTIIKGARARLVRLRQGECPVVIFLPSRTGDNIAGVARLLADALHNDGIDVADIVTVPRAVLDAKWTYPGTIRCPNVPHHAVLLDPACRTGHGTRQLLRVASTSEVRCITSFVLVDGLTDYEGLALQQIKSVEPVNIQTGRQLAGQVVPVSVNFLARTAVARIPAERCPICELRRTYFALPSTMPKALLAHRDTLVSVLEPRSKVDSYENTAAIDTFGIPVEAPDCVAYLTWRSILSEAVYDTEKRKEVADKLSSYITQPTLAQAAGTLHSAEVGIQSQVATERDGFIRLIAAESSWLRTAPLVFDDFTSLVSQIASSVIQSPTATQLEAIFRCQATIVLATADPFRFAQDLPHILRASADHQQPCSQVLLETVRLLESQHASKTLLQQLAESLTALEDITRDLQGEAYVAPAMHLHQLVRYVSSLARERSALIPDGPLAAWTALRSHHLSAVSEHAYDQPIWRLLVRLRNLNRGLYPSDPDAAIDDWLTCSESLFTQALANLEPLSSILLSKRVTSHISDTDLSRWHAIVSGRGQHLLDEMSLRIRQAFSTDIDATPLEPLSVLAAISDLEWWNRYFFSAPADDNSPRRDAILVSLLKQCPTALFAVIDEAFQGTDYQMRPSEVPYDYGAMVFCTNSLLSDLFFHLRQNAETTARVGVVPQLFEFVVTKDGSDHLLVRVLNSGSDSAQSVGGGYGLAELSADLAGFGAEIRPSSAEAPMTYAVDIRLRRWRAAW